MTPSHGIGAVTWIGSHGKRTARGKLPVSPRARETIVARLGLTSRILGSDSLMTLSLCLEMIFTDLPFPERLRAAASLGYRKVEFWDWKNKNLEELRRVADDLGLTVSAFSGNRQWTLIQPSHREALLDELKRSIDAAVQLSCPYLMLLTDRLLDDGSAAPVAQQLTGHDKLRSAVDSLAAISELANAANVTFVLEPLNTKLDHPGCFLNSSSLGFEIVKRTDAKNIRLLYDVYHMSVMGEDVVAALESGFDWLSYVHLADMPGRHEPGSGVIDFATIIAALQRLGYAGRAGLEFSPSLDSREAAAKAHEYLSLPG